MLRALGAIKVRAEAGEIEALFDAAAVQIGFEGSRTNSTAPQIEARTEDIKRVDLHLRGSRATIEGREYTVREHLPDGTGLSIVILDDE